MYGQIFSSGFINGDVDVDDT